MRSGMCMRNKNQGPQKQNATPDLPILQWAPTSQIMGSSEGAPWCSYSCSEQYVRLPSAPQIELIVTCFGVGMGFWFGHLQSSPKQKMKWDCQR